ncbi:uncharacterized protein [Temnothorax nylanderi]|uniref:uncharacterized protein n=1 Tax=Temnothorax nylanderi TaxID=102681 RepID=UPI003A86ED72
MGQRPGPYCFKIQGQIYYQFNTALHAAPNENPTYGQLFIVDSNESIDYRLNDNSNLDLEIVQNLEHIMREYNVFAQSYQMMGEELENQRQLELNQLELQLLFNLRPETDRRRYNAQRTNEVAAVFTTTADGEIPESYVVVRNKNTKTLQNISIMNPNVEPWIYPLFYPYGTQGWHCHLKKLNSDKRISRGQYVKYRMAIRDDFNIFLLGRRLFQQWLVDNYVRIERDRTEYCKTHQKELRSETYQGLIDYMQNMKRGLPHVHMLITLKRNFKITTSEIVDKYISAEIPDPCENHNLHNIIMRHMIHGPCGDWCLIDGKCSKHYPKTFVEETRMDEDAYPYYRRRDTGHDAASITIEPITENIVIDHDEIRNYIEARYVGPVEASWRILSKKLQDKSHAIIRLPVHLPNEQTLGLIEDDDEWKRAMDEAVGWMMPRQLRKLFVRILIHCQPLHPDELWESFKIAMSEDYARHFGMLQAQKKVYAQIGAMLLAEGKSFTDFPQMEQLIENNEEEGNVTVEQAMESKEAQYLKEIDIFIWDEAPMAPRYALEIMDRTLRDIMNNDVLFGGKIVILGGDFRQLLPIKVRENMRVLPNEIEFAKFLLNMGDGILNDFNDNVQIPECCIAPPNADIVTDIYGDLIQKKEFDNMAVRYFLREISM